MYGIDYEIGDEVNYRINYDYEINEEKIDYDDYDQCEEECEWFAENKKRTAPISRVISRRPRV